jgi:transposase InsO family protein
MLTERRMTLTLTAGSKASPGGMWEHESVVAEVYEPERAQKLPHALDSYNRYRPHRALAGQTPLQRVNDLSGTNS